MAITGTKKTVIGQFQNNESSDIFQTLGEGNNILCRMDSNGNITSASSSNGFVQGGNSSTSMKFDPTVNGGAYLVNRVDGLAASVMYFRNLNPTAVAYNTYTAAYLNTDGEFHWDTYISGALSSSLVLDVDGHVSLYGSSGGGIATDYITGETCIPPGTNGRPASFCTRFSSTTGGMTQYQGQTLYGGGAHVTVAIGASSLSSAITNFTMFTTNASGYCSAGVYRVEVTVQGTAASAGATVAVSVGYTSSAGAATQSSPAQSVATTGSAFTAIFLVDANASSAITISTTVANSPSYKISFRVSGSL